MVNYYRTPGGLYYKQTGSGQCRRVSKAEFVQQGGADAAIKRTKFEEECIEKAEAMIKEVKKNNADQIEKLKGRERGKFIANLVRETYIVAGNKEPDCKSVYEQEKERKDAAKAARRASRKKRRRTRSRKRKPSKKTSKKRSKSKSRK